MLVWFPRFELSGKGRYGQAQFSAVTADVDNNPDEPFRRLHLVGPVGKNGLKSMNRKPAFFNIKRRQSSPRLPENWLVVYRQSGEKRERKGQEKVSNRHVTNKMITGRAESEGPGGLKEVFTRATIVLSTWTHLGSDLTAKVHGRLLIEYPGKAHSIVILILRELTRRHLSRNVEHTCMFFQLWFHHQTTTP